MEFQRLNKKALICMYLVTSIICVIISAIAWTVFVMVSNGTIDVGAGTARIIKIVCVTVFVLELLETIISPIFRYRRYRYILTEEEVQVMKGYIFLTHIIVPISRLHKITVESGPIDRMFGLASVEVTTAGGDVTINFLEKEKAEMIAERLKKRINVIVEEEQEHGE